MSRFANLLETLRDIASERAGYVRQVEEARRELEELNAQPMNRTEALAALNAWIDEQQDHFTSTLERSLKIGCSPGKERLPQYSGLGFPLLRQPLGESHVVDQRMLVAVLSPLLKQAVAKSIAKISWPGCEGQCFAERRKRRGELEDEIRTLQERIDEIDQVNAQGRIAQ